MKLFGIQAMGYRFNMINIPAAMARIARITVRPPRPGINANRPQAISQMASNSMPIFFENLFILGFLSFWSDEYVMNSSSVFNSGVLKKHP
jgi:hypothetical protein